MHLAVDIPALNHSFYSQKQFTSPETKSCPHLGKENKGYCLHLGLMPQLKDDSEYGKHTLIFPPRTALEGFATNILQGFAEENLKLY